jgi:hypothetical protein
MNDTTPAITTRQSIGSAGDLHDATPVLANSNSHERRHTSSSDGTRTAEDDMIKGEKQPQPQMQGGVVGAGAPRGPPFRKFGHNCECCRWFILDAPAMLIDALWMCSLRSGTREYHAVRERMCFPADNVRCTWLRLHFVKSSSKSLSHSQHY